MGSAEAIFAVAQLFEARGAQRGERPSDPALELRQPVLGRLPIPHSRHVEHQLPFSGRVGDPHQHLSLPDRPLVEPLVDLPRYHLAVDRAGHLEQSLPLTQQGHPTAQPT